jgi:L-alanine-DL-glutamate epimerase-like enolase superfamily enzyme
VELRLDVNQCYSAAEAAAFLKSVPAAPNLFLEQPLPPGAWTEIAELAAQFSHRIVLDESIWTLADAQRAAAARVDRIKLKLCKHGGYLEMCNIARFAMESGLSVILGNGVQSAVGNALEAHAHSALGLAAAAECNGFARLADAQACAYISMSDDGRVKS